MVVVSAAVVTCWVVAVAADVSVFSSCDLVVLAAAVLSWWVVVVGRAVVVIGAPVVVVVTIGHTGSASSES